MKVWSILSIEVSLCRGFRCVGEVPEGIESIGKFFRVLDESSDNTPFGERFVYIIFPAICSYNQSILSRDILKTYKQRSVHPPPGSSLTTPCIYYNVFKLIGLIFFGFLFKNTNFVLSEPLGSKTFSRYVLQQFCHGQHSTNYGYIIYILFLSHHSIIIISYLFLIIFASILKQFKTPPSLLTIIFTLLWTTMTINNK